MKHDLLKKLILEVMSESQDPDSADVGAILDCFFEAFDSSNFGEEFINHLDSSLNDNAFFPVRIEDAEPMANAVAKNVVAALASGPFSVTNDAALKDIIAKHLARFYRYNLFESKKHTKERLNENGIMTSVGQNIMEALDRLKMARRLIDRDAIANKKDANVASEHNAVGAKLLKVETYLHNVLKELEGVKL